MQGGWLCNRVTDLMICRVVDQVTEWLSNMQGGWLGNSDWLCDLQGGWLGNKSNRRSDRQSGWLGNEKSDLISNSMAD
jgi:hypothetical protein